MTLFRARCDTRSGPGLVREWVGGETFWAADCSDWVGTSTGEGVENRYRV